MEKTTTRRDEAKDFTCTTLNFANDADAMAFAAELMEAHNVSQLCYSYDRECEIEFWWEYATTSGTNERDEEENQKRECMGKLFDFLKCECIAYK